MIDALGQQQRASLHLPGEVTRQFHLLPHQAAPMQKFSPKIEKWLDAEPPRDHAMSNQQYITAVNPVQEPERERREAETEPMSISPVAW